jgi:hypothetical protein
MFLLAFELVNRLPKITRDLSCHSLLVLLKELLELLLVVAKILLLLLILHLSFSPFLLEVSWRWNTPGSLWLLQGMKSHETQQY